MANSNLAGLRPQFPDTDLTLVVGSGGSTTIATNLYYWVNGYSRGGMNLLTSLGQKSVSVGQKLTWTVTTKAAGDDVFAWVLSASTTNDATQAKVLCLARAKGEDQLTVDDPPIAVQLTHDGHFSLGSIVGSLPTTNLLDGMIRYQDNAYRQYNSQTLAWEVVNGWDTYLSSTLASLSPGVYKGGCDVPILSNESIIPLPAYEGGTTPFLRLSILNGLSEGSGVILPTGTKLTLSARVNGSDEIGGNYLSGRIEIVPVQKTRRSDGTVTALSGGTITWVYGTPFYTLTSDLERGYALEFDVRVVDALLPEGFNFTFFISEYGTLSAPIAANASGTLIYGTGGRLRLVPALTGAFRLSGSGVIDVDGETVSYPINAPGKQQYSFGLQSDTADQVAAISGIGNGSIEFKANVNALLSTEAVRAIVSTEAITAAPSSWVSVGSVSANQSISLTVNYPCDTDGLGTIRADYPDVIANSTEGEFNPDRLRIFLRRNGATITETSPVNVTPGESQTLIITLVGSTATLPTDPGEDYNFWDYGTITPSVSVTTSNLPAGTYEVAIAYDYLGDKIVKISHSQADGAIPELSASLADTSNLASAYSDLYNQSGVLQSKVTELQFKDGLSVVKSGNRLIVTPDSQTHIRTTNPTTTDDSSQGYAVSDKWLNTVAKQEFTLVSAAIGAADWQQLGGGASTAADITVDTTNLNLNLSSVDNTVQKAIETLDELVAGGGVTFKGTWNSGTSYVQYDAVQYQGSAYIASASSINKVPGVDVEWDLWVEKGETGSTGATGSQGIQGEPGNDGADGAAATISVGTVTTGAAGSSVSVTNVGTSAAAIFDITIPKGDTGATGSATASSGLSLDHIATPSDPGAGKTIVYAKNDGKVYKRAAGGSEEEIGSGFTGTASDSTFRIQDNADATKQIAFEASGITTGTTRTLTAPNASGTIALTSDLFTLVSTKTTTYTANNKEEIPCNTITTGAFTITTPASGEFAVFDVGGTTPTTGFGVNNLTITPASGTIMGTTSYVLDVGAVRRRFILVGSDWRVA